MAETKLIPITINGRNALLLKGRRTCEIPEPLRAVLETDYPFRYDIRHSDHDWVTPATIEMTDVVVDFFGTVFCKKAFCFKGSDYIGVDSFEVKDNQP